MTRYSLAQVAMAALFVCSITALLFMLVFPVKPPTQSVQDSWPPPGLAGIWDCSFHSDGSVDCHRNATIKQHSTVVRYDSRTVETSPSCQYGALCPLLAVPGATITICESKAATSESNCKAHPAVTYLNGDAVIKCPSIAQLTPATGGSCSSSSGLDGSFGMWISPGSYVYWVIAPVGAGGGEYGPYAISID